MNVTLIHAGLVRDFLSDTLSHEILFISLMQDQNQNILFLRFKSKTGEPMGISQVRSSVRSAAIRAGLENFSGTHMLRHSAAKDMINSGIDIKVIADVLGHDSVETSPSEICKLRTLDVDLINGFIAVNETKFSKSRVLPIHRTTVENLREYLCKRNHLLQCNISEYFFLSTGGKELKLRNF